MNNNISWLFGLNSQYLKLQHTFDSTHTFSKVINPELPVPEPFNYGSIVASIQCAMCLSICILS